MKNLKQGVEVLVKKVFKDVYDYIPKDVRSLAGDPPNKENNFLFNASMLTYEGITTGKEGDVLFFIYFDPQKKDWAYNFIELPTK